MEQQRRVRRLVCHGYEIYPDGRLSKLCASVCQLTAQIHDDYDQVILLAGQHLQGAQQTVDLAMKTALIELGVPEGKIIVWSELCPEHRPPSTTMEEVDLTPTVFRALGCRPLDTKFDVACIWYYGGVVQFLFSQRGARLGYIRGASSIDPVRMATAFITYWVTRRDPTGEGGVYQKIKAKRTVFATRPGGGSWKENLPNAWNS